MGVAWGGHTWVYEEILRLVKTINTRVHVCLDMYVRKLVQGGLHATQSMPAWVPHRIGGISSKHSKFVDGQNTTVCVCV